MKRWARARSRLATATSVALPALRIAFQFLRAMLAEPRMPQRQRGCAMVCVVPCVEVNAWFRVIVVVTASYDNGPAPRGGATAWQSYNAPNASDPLARMS